MTRNSPMRTAMLTLTVGTLAILAGPSASAQEIKFAYRQYELQTLEGTRSVHERLMRKARAVCRNWGNVAAAEAMSRRACVAELSNQVVSKIGDSRLAAIHDATYEGTRFASRK